MVRIISYWSSVAHLKNIKKPTDIFKFKSEQSGNSVDWNEIAGDLDIDFSKLRL